MILISVKPGAPTEVCSQLPANSLIVNQDAVNAVWLSSIPSVAPNAGYRIGPLGSLQWSTQGAVYACVDTGVNTPILLSAGNDATAPNNPIDTATAVATQLLAKGVPSVLLTDTIIPNQIVANTSGQYDCSKFSTIYVQLGPPLGSSVACKLQFLDSGGFVSGEYTLVNTDDANNDPLIYSIPVAGTTLQIIHGLNAATGYIYIIGNNRSTSAAKMVSPWGSPLTLTYNGNITAGNEYQLIRNTGSTPAYSYYNGPFKGYASISGASLPAGSLAVSYLDYLGNGYQTLIDNTNTKNNLVTGLFDNLIIDSVHPLTPLSWLWKADNSVNNFIINLYLSGENQ